jgi:hypothetical protein
MSLPSYLPIRTSSDLANRVQLGATTESVTLEFKRDLDRWRSPNSAEREKGQKEFCRDLSQFANSFGGSLLLGIDESEADGVPTAQQITGVDDFNSHRAWMEQAATNYLNPSTLRFFIDQISTEQGLVIAVNVPPSERLVTVWDRNSGTIECLRRGNHGKIRMSPDELEASIMNTRRTAMLSLQRVSEGARDRRVDLDSGVWIYRPIPGRIPLQRASAGNVQLTAMNEHDFELHVTVEDLGTRILRIPYGLVRETWLTVDQRIGLLLNVRVVANDPGRIGLEPF